MRLGGGPALRLLLRLKLKGSLRKQGRRLRTPMGLLLGLVGGGIVLLWIATLALPAFLHRAPPEDPAALRPAVRLGALAMTLLTLATSLSHRGLFVPGEEIERLFSAPVSRSDLVRHRLLVNVGRSVFGAVLLGVMLMRHMPVPAFALAGAMVALSTLPVLGQAAAILAGALEARLFARIKLLRGAALPLGILVGAGVALLAVSDSGELGEHAARFLGRRDLSGLAGHPAVLALTVPFAPWARTVTATSLAEFLPWLGASLLLWIALYELAARLRVDYRELSLETAASIAERLRRVKSGGGGASGAPVSRRTLGWRLPWLLGRGPAGAVAWRKAGSIVRKARGTLIVSVLVLAFVTFLSTAIFPRSHDDAGSTAGTLLVAALGLFYLAGGLRFDFRDELDRMEVIKAWPVGRRRLFFAMLFPEALLITVLLGIAIVTRGAIAGDLGLVTAAAVLAVPLVAFAWMAIDNAVFLIAPVRLVPGQEGALQNVGRSLLLLFFRMLALAAATGIAFALGAIGWVCSGALDLGPTAQRAVAFGAGALAVLAVDVALIELGAWTIQRFDVARDRG